MDTYIGKFIGPRKITKLTLVETYKTTNGGSVFEVEYDGGFTDFVTESALKVVASDKEQDFNYIQDQKFNAMVPQVLAIMNEYDLPAYQLDGFFSRCLNALQNSFNRALSRMWYGHEKNFADGSNATDDFTLVETDMKLKEQDGKSK